MARVQHLVRRGNMLQFRISVPVRFRSILGVSEFNQSLNTQIYKNALPSVHKLASDAKTIFNYLDMLMDKSDDSEPLDVIFKRIEDAALESIIEAENDSDAPVIRSQFPLKAFLALKRQDLASKAKIEEIKAKHEAELKQASIRHERLLLERENEILRANQVNAGAPLETKVKPVVSKAPLLSAALGEFMSAYSGGKGSSNGSEYKKKIGTFKKLFILYLGDVKIDQINQTQINKFFKSLIEYPGGRKGFTNEFEKLSFPQRVEYGKAKNYPLMSPTTFVNSYTSPAKQFFEWLLCNYADCAPTLTVAHINYNKTGGKRNHGEEKQRSLTITEVEKLVCNEKIKGFVNNPAEVDKYWLVMIGLFTGARVNEICQINPQHDVVKDVKTGIWYFHLTNSTPAGIGVVKSFKNKDSERKIPIHSALINCGFINHFKKIKTAGHDRLFNSFKPNGDNPSYHAELFFRDYLRDTGLRDETVGKKVLGMHSLRSTFITHHARSVIDAGFTLNQAFARIRPIVGHCDGAVDENGNNLSITKGYADMEMLKEFSEDINGLKAIVEELNYSVEFPVVC